MPTHYIPEHVTYVARAAIPYLQAYTGKGFNVRPAFVLPSTSKAMLATARKWADRVGGVDLEKTVPNRAHTNIQVVGIEHRSEGGVAYKVINDEGFLMDLREPEFMEAFLTGKIGRDGFISGSYVWSIGGNQMRLVRVGSEIYSTRLREGLLANPLVGTSAGGSTTGGKSRVKYLATSTLVRGHKYQTAMWGDVVYGGRIRRLSDKKLLFAWFQPRESTNPLGRGEGRKDLVITTSSIALQDLGATPPSGSALIAQITNGYGEPLSRESYEWPDGHLVRVS